MVYRILSIGLCVISITACTTDLPTMGSDYQPYAYSNVPFYPIEYNSDSTMASELPAKKQAVDAPDSYHVGGAHSPTPHTDVDRSWVSSQNSQSYTIELGDGDQPSQIANTLLKAPKEERTAEIRYQREGKTYYKGLYGSYPNQEAARQALSKLPDDVKQKAGIKSWSNVQNETNQ